MPDPQSPAGRQSPLKGVTHIVAVSSAKGGVGKSTVAANLAVALAGLGRRVGLADVDIYGPSAPIMFGTSRLPAPAGESQMIEPLEAYGIKFMSMGFFLDENAPVVWRGPMVMSATRQFLRGVAWGELDVLVVDLPPGTGDIGLTLAQEVPLAGGIVVTTPQDVALADVARGVAMFGKLNTPVLGVIDNMAGYICPQCGTEDDIFGERTGEEVARALGVPLLATLPLVSAVREAADGGEPLVLSMRDHPVSLAFVDLAVAVDAKLAEASAATGGVEPQKIEHDADTASLVIDWTDGTQTRYALAGLRGWCPCAQCQGHGGRLGFVEGGDATLDSFEGVGRYAVRFLWADGHSTGMYSYAWLREIAECRT